LCRTGDQKKEDWRRAVTKGGVRRGKKSKRSQREVNERGSARNIFRKSYSDDTYDKEVQKNILEFESERGAKPGLAAEIVYE